MRLPTSRKITDYDDTTDSCASQSRAEHLCGPFPEESISETVTCIMGLSCCGEASGDAKLVDQTSSSLHALRDLIQLKILLWGTSSVSPLLYDS